MGWAVQNWATPDEGLRDWLVGLLGKGRGYPVKNGGVSK